MTKWLLYNFFFIIYLLFGSNAYCSEEKSMDYHFNKLSSLDSSRMSFGIGSQFDKKLFILSSLKLSSNLDAIINYSYNKEIDIQGLYYSIGLRFNTSGIVKEKIVDFFQIGINRYRFNGSINRWIDFSLIKRFFIEHYFINFGYSTMFNKSFIHSKYLLGIEKSMNNLAIQYWIGYNLDSNLINMISIRYQI